MLLLGIYQSLLLLHALHCFEVDMTIASVFTAQLLGWLTSVIAIYYCVYKNLWVALNISIPKYKTSAWLRESVSFTINGTVQVLKVKSRPLIF